MDRRHFQRGLKPTFVCDVCGRRTRNPESEVCCAECWELAGADNYHNDNAVAPTADELAYYESVVATIAGRGGNANDVRKAFPFIWSKP